MKYIFQGYQLTYDEKIEKDINNPLFFLKIEYFIQFFFFFFFRCLYAILYDYLYIQLHRKNLIIDKKLIHNDVQGESVLFIWDSTICFPVQSDSFPYQFFENKYAKYVRIIAKFGLKTHMVKDYIQPMLDVNRERYHTIFVSSMLNDIMHTNVGVEQFEDGVNKLLEYLKTRLVAGGRIIFIYGDFSLHLIVPNNYFKQYFHYKTYRFLSTIEKYVWDDLIICKLMDFKATENAWYIRNCFYHDGLHFSKAGQKRLYQDLIRNANF